MYGRISMFTLSIFLTLDFTLTDSLIIIFLHWLQSIPPNAPVGRRCDFDILATTEREAPWGTPCKFFSHSAHFNFLCFFPFVYILVSLAERRNARCFLRSDLLGMCNRHSFFLFLILIVCIEHLIHDYGDEETAEHVEPEPVPLCSPHQVEREE